MQAGAHGITVHPRPDARHIRTQRRARAAALLKHWPQAEYNIEGNPFHNLMELVRALRPQQCTFVPDAPSNPPPTTAGTCPPTAPRLRPLIDELQALGVRVSLFMDPLPQAMPEARDLGADRVELYTEPFARAHGTPAQAEVLAAYAARPPRPRWPPGWASTPATT